MAESDNPQGPTEGGQAAANSARVFISYASADKAAADSICAGLERGGIACWIAPRDVTPGVFYADAIVEAINSARILIVVLSINSVGSQHVLREVERASAKRRPLVTFRLDTTPLPTGLEYFLSASHWLDASAGTIEHALPELVTAVHRLLGAPEMPGPGASLRGDSSVNASDWVNAIRGSTPKSRPKRLWIATVAAVLLLALLVGKSWRSNRSALQNATAPVATVTPATIPAASTISDKSVAVLPFVDMSEKKDQEYFADGLSEELINMLTKIPDLRVPARTSSFYFKGKSEDIPTIARRLMVAHVLEGSVRKSGKYLRITAQLVRADNGYHLWSQTYDRKLDDIFKVQDEIAANVVSALKVSLADSSTLKGTTPKNSEAYTLYLQGRAINRIASNKQQFDSAAEYMRKAIKADPTFSKVWAWLEIVLANEIQLGLVRSDAVAAEMRHASERALALDPNLADAHGALGDIYFHINWDWEAAEAEFQKAYDLDPTDANNANVLAAILFGLHGPSDTVLALYQKSVKLDPLNSLGEANTGGYYTYTGKLSEAEKAYRKAIEIDPMQSNYHAGLAAVLLLRGEAAAALAESQRASKESDQRQGAAEAYFALGRRAESNAKLAEMERLDATTNAAGIAETYAYRGEIDQAFAWLDRAYQQHDAGLETINRDFFMNSLHGDPRWKAFLRKMKLPE
jgi:TolB-like protein/Tfp pilus assembly protein PilF